MRVGEGMKKMKCGAIKFTKKEMIIVGLILVVGIVLRFLATSFPHNFDFESYKIQGEIVSGFGNIYARTTRYNYGPLYGMLMGILYSIASLFRDSMVVFRYMIVAALTLTDIAIMAILVFRYKNILAAAFFFLNPVSIIITGCHHQFDNIAILFALIALMFINDEKRINKKDVLFVAFMGISLVTKHIAVFFLFWILINNKMWFKRRIFYSMIPPIIFFLSFVPFFRGGGAGKAGIINNVFLYKSFNNFPLLIDKLEFFEIPEQFYTVIFVVLLIVCGIYFRRKDIEQSFFLYLICMVAFSSAIANQYLAIPLVGLALLSKGAKYFYTVVVSLHLVLNVDGFGMLNKWIEGVPPESYTYLQVIAVTFQQQRAYSIAAVILFIIALKHTGLFAEKWKKLI